MARRGAWLKGKVYRPKRARDVGALTSTARSEAHLLLHVLVDPNARMDRARTHRARAQFAAIILQPWPPSCVVVGDWQEDVGRLVDDFYRHLLQHLLALAFVLLLIDNFHFFIECGVGILR